jgi:hypothetical protein
MAFIPSDPPPLSTLQLRRGKPLRKTGKKNGKVVTSMVRDPGIPLLILPKDIASEYDGL